MSMLAEIEQRRRNFRVKIAQKATELEERKRPKPALAPISTTLPPIPNWMIAEAAEIAFPSESGEVKQIQLAVLAEFEGLTLNDLMSRRRTEPLSSVRQIAMYLCHKRTGLSIPYLGRRFGRDHSTVFYSIMKVQRLRMERPELSDLLDRIEDTLGVRE